MLFDLRGKRKRAIQVIYAGLAVLMGGGLILFGVGSGVSGGLLDAIKGGGGGGGSGQFDDKAAKLDRQARLHPKDAAVLLTLARTRFLAGNVQVKSDPTTGQTQVTQSAVDEFSKSADAWDKYLKLKPKNPSVNVAAVMVQAYQALGDAAGAATAQQIVVKARPSQGSYASLAFYLYAGGKFAAGDAAAAKAVKLATGSNRSLIKQRLTQIRQQSKQFIAQQKKQAKQQAKIPGQNPLQNPLGGFSGGGTGAP